MNNRTYNTRFENTGFTLIELLVVVSIIGLLSSVVLASLSTARTKSRDARRLADFRQITTALELYYDDFDSYPDSGAAWDDDGNNCDGNYPAFGDLLTPDYMASVSKDPVAGGNRCYWYQARNSAQGYILLVQPEQSELLDDDMDCYIPASWYCVGVNW